MIKVIVVEDENRIREGFIRMVDWHRFGMEIVGTARNGSDGLRLIERLNPDLVFVDIKMPIMNGFEMLEESKDVFDAIIVSGYDEFAYAKKALQYQVFDYLLKPVDPLELEALLKRYQDHASGAKRRERLQEELDDFLKRPSSQNPLFRKSLRYIEKHVHEEIGSEYLASYLGISYSKLNTMYQEETGDTFRQFLIKYRLRKAMYLLSETDLLAYEIAEAVGYSDYKYFSDLFKKHNQLTLTEYREYIRDKIDI